MELSPIEAKLKVRELMNEELPLRVAIGYFTKYGEPSSFKGIRGALIEKDKRLRREIKTYEETLRRLVLPSP